MNNRNIILTIIMLIMPFAYAAEGDGRDARRLASSNQAGSPAQFYNLCMGRDGAVWCDGYFSGVLSSLGITNDQECVRGVDVARFIHERAWLTTTDWLYRQQGDIRITYYEAVYRALSEQDSCNL